jgi:regulation of enolase protein 1 (concanavalin A-like superfamily)
VSAAFDVTSTFSHTPTGYTQSDIAVTNGTISNFTAGSFRVTPTANGLVTVKIAANLVTDPSGLGNAESNTLNVTFTTTTPPAGTLAGADIGSVGVTGSTSLSGGVYTMRGSGSDIYGSADSFQFASLSLAGDGEIRARITSMSNTGDWAKSGVMIRENTTAGSRNAIVFYTPYETGNGSEMMWRQTANSDTTYFEGPLHNPPPNNWVRLVRSGNTVTGYVSANGTSWTQIQTVTFASLPSSMLFGLCVSSTNNAALATATFDNVQIIGATAPAAPTNLVATATSSTTANITWSDIATNETGYRVERATGAGAYSVIATLAANVTSYADSGLAASTTYNYKVSAFNATGAGTSGPAPITTPAAPATLAGADIGSVGVAGSTSLSGGVYTVRGSGSDIYFNADSFHFASLSLNGDGEIRARITSMSNTGDWAKSGVMIRENTSAGSRNAIVFYTPYETGNGSEMMWRQTANDATTYFEGPLHNPPPNNWVRLVRSGNTVTGYVSANGTNWAQIQTVTFASLPSSMLFGLCVSSTNNAALATATFDNVQILNGSGAPLAQSSQGNLSTGNSTGSTPALTVPKLITTTHANGSLSLSYTRIPGDRTYYSLQFLDDLTQMSGGWRGGYPEPDIVTHSDGSQTVTYRHLPDLFPGATQGFARLMIHQDVEGDGHAELVSLSEISGFTRHTYVTGAATFGQTLASPEIVRTTISTVGAGRLNLNADVPLLAPGVQYYAEIVRGVNEGHRFEIDETTTTGGSLAVDIASTRNTLSTLPATLTADTVVIRAHRTLDDLFPATLFSAATIAQNADRILLFNGAAFDTFWLMRRTDGTAQWTRQDDATLANAGTRVVDVTEGALVQLRSSAVTLTTLGIVRQHKVAMPISAGTRLIAMPWATDLSPWQLGMTAGRGFTSGVSAATADRIQLWRGDFNPEDSGYLTWYLRSTNGAAQWTSNDNALLVDETQTRFIPSARAIFLKSVNAKPGFITLQPWR